MKRIIAAALAALGLLTAAAPAWAAHYYYIPVFIPGPGVAAVPDPDVGSYTGIKKVAILSSLGAGLTMRHGELTMPLDISAWKVDQEVAATIRKYLGGRYEFTDMSFDTAAVNALPMAFMREMKTSDLVRTFTNPGVDAYILVRPQSAEEGLELFAATNGQVSLLAHYEIDVIDAHTGRYISKSVGRMADLPGDKPQFPGISMPDDFWSGYDRTLPASRMELLHKYLTQMMKRSLVETIRSLEFGVALPPTGDHSIAEPIMADAFSSLRSVAVVSAVGNQLQMITPGNMFITRTDVNLPIADWGLDDRIEAMLCDTLSKHYTVKPVHANREVLSRQLLTGGERLTYIPGFDATRDVDAFVVVLPAVQRGRPYHGLGMVHWKGLMNSGGDVYADYAIVIVDARNLVPVNGFFAVRGQTSCGPSGLGQQDVPECKVDGKLWPGKHGDPLSPDAAVQVRQALENLLVTSIPQTLFQVGLDVPQTAGAQAAAQ